ncbi:SDR family oxidoreductase [Frankia sp. AgB1.9]|uniref:SDR family oxidoreductase n=1 Tax=unclassified Frankia TaxID=2632575 RepID=UPI0019343B13|nr:MULTISPECIES: SDR family oxidoreductase [unclassified Frankia]MBL7487648.1 SDR family oxidoreductase [Frankia sp. AgW1.1]MBL7550026.1 SDR family oxidoreductase [Frankia sp. AgB1.9]MBL7621909.1 SDR family oxidoreductase [Frankia sp. AgB1.8]
MNGSTGATPGTVVITGGGTGIGQAAAQKFAALGWRVVVGGRREAKLAETAAIVEKEGGSCLTHRLDVTDGESVEQFFDAAEATFGTVAAVVSNAATARYGPLEDFSPDEIHREVATKLIGGLYVAGRAIRGLRAAGVGGDILFMTSLAGAQPWPLHLPYAAASAGLEHAARTLRMELEGTGIRVTTLRCGETMGTDFSTTERESGRIQSANELWFRRGLLRHTGLMTPARVADAIVAAITLPADYQYDNLTVIPTAPVGDLPHSHAEWGAAMMERYLPS